MIFKIPETLTGLPTPLFLIGAFAVFFVVVGVWLARKFAPGAVSGKLGLNEDLLLPGNIAAQLPILSAVLPFLLLIMVTLRLPLTNPSPVFGLALLLVVLMLGSDAALLARLDAGGGRVLRCSAGSHLAFQPL